MWDPADFDGVTSLRVDPSKLWIPDIVLYNKGYVKSRPKQVTKIHLNPFQHFSKHQGKPNQPQRIQGSFCDALVYSNGMVRQLTTNRAIAGCSLL